MLRVNNFNLEILKWAAERYSNGNLHQKFPKLADWIEGSKYPTIGQLADFSKAASIPFGYFFLETIPDLKTGVPLFRTQSPHPTENYSSELRDTINIIKNRQDWLKDYLLSEGVSPLEFVGSFNLESDPEEVAQSITNTLGLEKGWAEQFSNWEKALKFLFDKTEGSDIFIAINGVVENNTHRALDPNEFRGFVLTDKYAPYVFINGKDFIAAKMFTLAHELAHIWLGETAAFDLKFMQPANEAIEKICNQIAAEFLVPKDTLNETWKLLDNKNNAIQDIARKFKVSQIVAARRLLDTNKITQEAFMNFYDQYVQSWKDFQKKRKGGGDFYNNQNYRVGKRFFGEVNTAAKEGKLLYTDAYKLTGLYGRTYSKFEKDYFNKS
jgi:Zn-dependent peptidase ImmA (M78 family)